MFHPPPKFGLQNLLSLFFCLIFACLTIYPEKLPTRIYTVADGLPRDVINCITQDSRGFIWFCTPEGLSRFDGYEFKNYPQSYGLPSRNVNEFLETRSGKIWIGTDKGLVLFNPKGQPANATSPTPNRAEPMFTTFKLSAEFEENQAINKLFEDSQGTVWIGANIGFFRLDEKNGEPKIQQIDLGESPSGKYHYIFDIIEDTDGNLWICTNNLLFKRRTDGILERFGKENGFLEGEGNDPNTKYPFTSILQDSEGRIWVGTAFGLARLGKNPQPDQKIVERIFTEKDGLSQTNVGGLFLSKDQKIWARTSLGICKFLPDSESFQSYTKENGLTEGGARAMIEDAEGNLWVAQGSGAVKIAHGGFTNFYTLDGLTFQSAAVYENRAGEIYSLSDHLGAGQETIFRFDKNKFTGFKISALQNLKNYGWGIHQVAFQDREGEWWFPTGVGLYRFPKTEKIENLVNLQPKYVYTKKDGLANDEIFRLFEDSRGDIWISTIYEPPSLNRWNRATNTIDSFSFEGDKDHGTPMSYTEDTHGNVWFGSYYNRLMRYKDGKFSIFLKENGLPEGYLRSLHVDRKGRLWGITSEGGVFHIDDTDADTPKFSVLTTNDGLSSNVVVAVTEDSQGRMYFATGRGIDRYEPETARIKHFTTADGLGSNYFIDAKSDKNGALWFVTTSGISRLVPEAESKTTAPTIFINKLRIADKDYPISEFGETEISNLEMSPDSNQIEASFVSPNFSGNDNLRYQYKLEGSDTDWREPTKQRNVNFASLSAGNYRFLVRAINAEGQISEKPAVISFKVLPPIWQRWWFLTALAILIGLLVYAVYRYRLQRLLELERIRTRIATDLHDDIGSSLSQIAILSEVVRQKVGDNGANKPLNLIADTSRELVDSMSDIVWAINPSKDSLSDLTKRMRRFATDVLEAKDIAVKFEFPASSPDISLGADIRREFYLMFKECVNNLAKHSEATEANIGVLIESGSLILKLKDNGKGFHVPPFDEHTTFEGFGGNGLLNLKKRTENLGGKFEIQSEGGKGTEILLEIPISVKKWVKFN